jgi:hypothetical protein
MIVMISWVGILALGEWPSLTKVGCRCDGWVRSDSHQVAWDKYSHARCVRGVSTTADAADIQLSRYLVSCWSLKTKRQVKHRGLNSRDEVCWGLGSGYNGGPRDPMGNSLSHVRPPGCTGGSCIDHSIQGALRDWMARPPSGMKGRRWRPHHVASRLQRRMFPASSRLGPRRRSPSPALTASAPFMAGQRERRHGKFWRLNSPGVAGERGTNLRSQALMLTLLARRPGAPTKRGGTYLVCLELVQTRFCRWILNGWARREQGSRHGG